MDRRRRLRLSSHMTNYTVTTTRKQLILLTGGTGTTGRRIGARLRARDIPVRTASRAGVPPFEWNAPETWSAMLDGVTTAYIAYSPDLTIPGAVETVEHFCAEAQRSGVEKLVLLAGRGEKEAEAAEDVVKACGARWTIVRASWFNQNFSEGMLLPAVLAGTIALPGGNVSEPFVDVEDIADVAMASLVDSAHDSRTYDVTGPRLMTFGEAADELSAASGRPVSYLHVTGSEFVAGAMADGVPEPIAEVLAVMFEGILDGRNAHLGDGVQEALGQPARDFATFASRAAAEGAWTTSTVRDSA
jgi:uncharacterized protein YbjT (DUF2867 family)